jgi:hypothetical protein
VRRPFERLGQIGRAMSLSSHQAGPLLHGTCFLSEASAERCSTSSRL